MVLKRRQKAVKKLKSLEIFTWSLTPVSRIPYKTMIFQSLREQKTTIRCFLKKATSNDTQVQQSFISVTYLFFFLLPCFDLFVYVLVQRSLRACGVKHWNRPNISYRLQTSIGISIGFSANVPIIFKKFHVSNSNRNYLSTRTFNCQQPGEKSTLFNVSLNFQGQFSNLTPLYLAFQSGKLQNTSIE